jgi:hypothetical protein
MRKLLAGALLVLTFSACGDKDGAPEPRTTPAPAATTAADSHDLDGYSEGVKAYYGADAHPEAEPGSIEDVESEYHQPPKPAEAKLGETITLTGSNIGVRLDVTVEQVRRVDDYLAVDVALDSTGITNYEGPFENASVTFPDGTSEKAIADETAACSKDFTVPTTFIGVGEQAKGCLLFEPSGSALPERFQFALESVPVEAGGIWNLG